MLRKVFKTGNSIVVSLPKDMLELLGISAGSNVSIYLDENKQQIIVRAVEKPIKGSIDETFARQINDFIEQYRHALEALAHQ